MPGSVGSSGNPAACLHAGLPPTNAGGGGGAACRAVSDQFGFVRLTTRRAGASGSDGFAARLTKGLGEVSTCARRGFSGTAGWAASNFWYSVSLSALSAASSAELRKEVGA